MSFKKKIFEITDKILPEITSVRQNIHRYPELAGQEVQTSRLVRNILSFTDI